jgi:tetratricopeptide (TPR) repeat protein
LLQLSTDKLYGRKLFVWGQGNGGKNWQDFLSGGRGSYIEIQAGLAHTQLQHIKMEGATTWSWCEAYGAIDVDEAKAHSDYKTAVNTVKDYIKNYFPNGVNEMLSEVLEGYKTAKVDEPIRLGSGWGTLKNSENAITGEKPISSLSFHKEAIDEEQELFYRLLEDGKLDKIDEKQAPKGYVTSEFFEKKFEEAIANGSENWNTYYHLGVIKYALGKVEESEKAWKKSASLTPNCWAFRNLAMLERNVYHNSEKAVEYMQTSVKLNPVLSIEKDYGETLIKAELYEKWLEYFDGDCVNKQSERLQFYKAYALKKLRRYEEASKIVNENYTLSDIKEGELSVSELWYEIYGPIITGRDDMDEKERNAIVDKERPLGKLDFRMH